MFVRFLELPESLFPILKITDIKEILEIKFEKGCLCHIRKRIMTDCIQVFVEVIMTTILTCSNHLVSLIEFIQGENIYAYAKQERQMPELPDGTAAVGNLGERHVILRVEGPTLVLPCREGI